MTQKLLLLTTFILSSSLYSQATITGAIKLRNGKVFPNARVFHKKDKSVIAEFECGKRLVFKESEISETEIKPLTRWKTQEECNQTEEEAKQAVDSGKWSEYQGYLNWEDAKAKCASIKMRLPTIEELRKAYVDKVTESWKKDSSVYWSSTPVGDDRAYGLDIFYGDSYDFGRTFVSLVRCLR